MKYLFSLLLIVLFSSGFRTQINQVDAQGRKQGVWKKTYPNSSVLMYHGSFVDNKPTGLFIYYNKNRTKKALMNHNHLTGRSVVNFFHSNGQLMSVGIYNNQKKDSIWREFNIDGKLIEISKYNKGKLDGLKQLYYVTGELAQYKSLLHSIKTFSGGMANGQYFEYFMDGSIKIKGHYLNDNKDGLWQIYNEKGIIVISERYKNKKKHGWCVYLNENDDTKLKQYFFEGELLKGKERLNKLNELKEKGINPND